MNYKKNIFFIIISTILIVPGCGSMNIAIKKHTLEVKTKVSKTIFLEPSSNQTIYLQIKNNSDKDFSSIQNKVSHALRIKGYKIVNIPGIARYLIQANILKAEKIELKDTKGFLKNSFDSGSITGMILGTGISGYNNNSIGTVLISGLVTGLIGSLVDIFIEDVYYIIIADIQIGDIIKVQKVQTDTSINTISFQKNYQTRIISIANKINLKLNEAKPVLEDQLVRSIVSIF